MKLFTVVLALAAFAPVQGHKSEIMEVQLKPDTIHPHLPRHQNDTNQPAFVLVRDAQNISAQPTHTPTRMCLCELGQVFRLV